MRGRPWLPSEEEILRTQYLKVPAKHIAHRLGRTVKSVRWHASKLGLTFDRRAEFGGAFTRFLKAKHAEGWSDTDIAREWCCDIQPVTRKRKELGLPSNKFNDRHNAKLRKRYKLTLQEAGVKNLRGLRSMAWRIEAHRRGYPEGITPRQAKILDLLKEGPKTRRMLADAMGLKWRGCRTLVTGNRSLVADLVKKGLVKRLGSQEGLLEGQERREVVFALVEREPQAEAA